MDLTVAVGCRVFHQQGHETLLSESEALLKSDDIEQVIPPEHHLHWQRVFDERMNQSRERNSDFDIPFSDVLVPRAPDGVPHLKLGLVVYCDAFNALQRNYHSISGIYISVANLPRSVTNQTKNKYLLGLVPPGGFILCLLG